MKSKRVIRRLIIFMLFSQSIFAQDYYGFPDCNCRKEGDCIQYLDSLLNPTKKKNAVYMRYNYQYRFFLNLFKFYRIMGDSESEDCIVEVNGRKYQKDTIVFLDGIYKQIDNDRIREYDLEYHYKEGVPVKFIMEKTSGPGTYSIYNYNQWYGKKWSYIIEDYDKNGKLYSKAYWSNDRMIKRSE